MSAVDTIKSLVASASEATSSINLKFKPATGAGNLNAAVLVAMLHKKVVPESAAVKIRVFASAAPPVPSPDGVIDSIYLNVAAVAFEMVVTPVTS